MTRRSRVTEHLRALKPLSVHGSGWRRYEPGDNRQHRGKLGVTGGSLANSRELPGQPTQRTIQRPDGPSVISVSGPAAGTDAGAGFGG